MKAVNVNKTKLLELVRKNRDQHRAQYEKAFAGYRKECYEVLEANLKALQTDKAHIVRFREQPPEDHTDDYDRAIQMLEMSVDDVIELHASEFSNFVQDDWEWKERWSASNSSYISKSG